MERKTILIILSVVIILAIGGVYILNNQNFQENNQVKVGSALFVLPNGFHEVNSSDAGVIISDDKTMFKIFNYDDNEIDKYVNQYNDSKSEENIPVVINNLTIGDYWVYKANAADNPYVVHYWFVFNHKVYSIYTEDGNKNTDGFVSDLIKSMKNV